MYLANTIILYKTVSGCFNGKTRALENHVRGKHSFKSIHTPEECQKKCQENAECEYFVLHLKGRWKGCWMKKGGANQTVNQTKMQFLVQNIVKVIL